LYLLAVLLGGACIVAQLSHYMHSLDHTLPHGQTHRVQGVNRTHFQYDHLLSPQDQVADNESFESFADSHRERIPTNKQRLDMEMQKNYEDSDPSSGSADLTLGSSTSEEVQAMEVELGMVDHDTSSGSDQAEGLSVALRVSSHDMYEKHPLAASNRTGGIFLGGYKGSIAMNQGSLRVGHTISSPFQHREGSRLSQGNGHLASVTPEVRRLFPGVDPLAGVRFDTCAVVGSAGLLLIREFGPEIDAHDAVFRFNLAPVRTFEQFVGSKTTIRLINRKHFGFRETWSELCLQHVTTVDVMKQFLEYRQLHPGLYNYAVDMEWYKHVTQNTSKISERPTNGLYGLNLANMLCKKINIYGFLRNWKGWVKYHYFNPEEPNSQQLQRDTSGEMPVIEALLKANPKMHFAHPCVINQQCEGCIEGVMCDPKGVAPFPIPVPGYCQRKGTQCIAKCPVGTICKGGSRDKGTCPQEVVDSADFACTDSHSGMYDRGMMTDPQNNIQM